eukprot:6012882-Prymnesium_polylepis.2
MSAAREIRSDEAAGHMLRFVESGSYSTPASLVGDHVELIHERAAGQVRRWQRGGELAMHGQRASGPAHGQVGGGGEAGRP